MAAEDYIPFPIDFDEDEERAREAMGEDGYFGLQSDRYIQNETDVDCLDQEIWF